MKKLLILAVALMTTFMVNDVQAVQKTYKPVKIESAPKYLYQVVSIDQWQGSLLRQRVVTSSNAGEFGMFATENQLYHVVDKYWNSKDHVIVKVDSKKIGEKLVLETNTKESTTFYFLFEGDVPLEAVESFTVVYSA